MKQMDTLSDMRPSNNYIINGLQFVLNFIHKVTGRETNGHIIRHASFQ